MSDPADSVPQANSLPSLMDIQRKVHAELMQVVPHLERVTGRTSRWNGIVATDLAPEDDALAVFRSDGSISVIPTVAMRKVRWRVFLHELCHSIGEPINRSGYEALKGWEEGPVEMLQRSIRPTVLGAAGIVYDEEYLQKIEAFWPFNAYVQSIERLCSILGEDPISLALFLLSIPLEVRGPTLAMQNRSHIAMISRESATMKAKIITGTMTTEQMHLFEERD